MGSRLLVGALVGALAPCFAAPLASAHVHLTPIGSFQSPLYVTAPPGDAKRLFVVEKDGRIMEVRNGLERPKPFLDISGEVRSVAEQGLLSMAFAPDYASSRTLYIDYTARRPGDPGGSVITVQELNTLAGNPDAIDPASRRTILAIDHPRYPHHHGGQLAIGPDGALFVSTGDGGNGHDFDAANNAQRPASLLGKLLRIDPASGVASVFATGLRNPWRFSFDPPTGRLVIGDVGEEAYEEVDVAPQGSGAGVNYGWRCLEGFQRTPRRCTGLNRMTPPVLVKSHSEDGFCALVGGYVVRDRSLGALYGRYLYGDHCQTRIRSAELVAPPARVRKDGPAGLRVGQLNSFGQDSCGHIYTASAGGIVGRIDGERFRPCPGGGPALRIAARLRRDGVQVTLYCGRPCAAKVRGVAGDRVLRTVRSRLARRARVKLALPVRALARRRLVRIALTVTAVDAAGNRTLGATTIRARSRSLRQHMAHG